MILQAPRRGRARRYILFVLTIALASAISFAAGTIFHSRPNDSPHANALAFLLSKDIATISKIEKDHDAWWFDTKPRQWIVKRPFAPGIIDTTHSFEVVYSIEGNEVANWSVDTDRQEIKVVNGYTIYPKEGSK